MKNEDSDALTTSFLDVITCGLGSILLLFFLMVAIKGDMQFNEAAPERPAPDKVGQADAPFILMVTSADGKPIWAPGVEKPWKEGQPAFTCATSHGGTHAILYAGRSPPPGWSARVGPLDRAARVTVEVVADGRRMDPWRNLDAKTHPLADGEYLRVWPLPKGKGK